MSNKSARKRVMRYQQQLLKEEKRKKRRKALIISVSVLSVLIVIASVVCSYLFLVKWKPVTVALEVEGYGDITLELYPYYAPITVENFVSYVEEGFYDGLTFHRVIQNFMIQGGDPTGTGIGDSSLEKIKGEFSANGVKNNLKFERGVIGMARSSDYDSATSQFFICQEDDQVSHLNGQYAAFGRVVDGMEVVDSIAACDKTTEVESGQHYVPAEKIIITRAYVVE